MARAIVYCDRCGRKILPSEVDEALLADWVALCRDCLNALSPEERRSLGIERPTRAAGQRKKFGRYELVRELGRGGQAVVYEARDPELGRAVALKILLPGSRTADGIRRFQREARSAARLRHRNVISIYEVGEWRGWHFIAMEIAPGKPLDALIASRRLGARDAVHLVEQIADAVHSAHQEGIIHRDLKPSNILMDAAGNPRLTDFGFALDVDAGTKLTRSGDMMGTPAYMAPEQARGRGHEVDERSDVHSLGAVLYEMLTGRPPFRARSSLLLLEKVVYELPKNPSEIRKAVPEDAATIALKCLEKEPGRRYQTAGELADDCRRFLAGEPVSARRPSLTYKARRSMARHAAVLTILGVGFAAMMGMMIGSAVVMSRERAELEKWREEVDKRRKAAEEARDTLASAKALFSEGKLAQAEQVLQKLLGRDVTARPKPAREPAARLPPAAKRLAEIRRIFDGSFRNYEEGRKILRAFLKEFPDAPEAEKARARLAEISIGETVRAKEAVAKAAERAGVLAARGRFDEAAKVLDAVRERFGESEWFKSEGEEKTASVLKSMEKARLDAAKRTIARADELLGEERFDEARAALADRAAWPEEIRRRAEELVVKIASARKAAEQKQRRLDAWIEFVIGLNEAGKTSLAEAGAYLERERKRLQELGLGSDKPKKLARIERRFRLAKLVEDVAEIALGNARSAVRFRWKGEIVAGRVVGVDKGVLRLKTTRRRDVSVPISEIAAEDVVVHSRVMRRSTKDPVKAGSYYLLRGDLDAARKVIDGLASNASHALEEDIDLVASAFEAQRARGAAAAEAARRAAAKAEAEAARVEARKRATAGLVAHWTFDDRADPGADSSGKGHHGKVHGAMWTAKGKLGGALRFDGRDDYVAVPYVRIHNTSLTFAAWVKLSRDMATIFSDWRGPHAFWFAVWDNRLLFRLNNTEVKDLVNANKGSVPCNSWQHVAATWDRGNRIATWYVNGNRVGAQAALQANINVKHNVRDYHVGWKQDSTADFPPPLFLNGVVDDVRIYSRALSADEVAALYAGRAARTASAAKPEPPSAKPEVSLPGGPKEPLPGETGFPGEWAPGLVCEVFKGRDFRTRVAVRIDPSPLCDYGKAPPDLGLGPGEYSFRWSGCFFAPVPGAYSFNRYEGFARFEIDGKKALGVPGGVKLTKGLHRLEATARGVADGARMWLQFGGPEGAKDLGSLLYHEVPELGSMGPFAKLVRGLKAEYFKDDSCRRLVSTGTLENLEFALIHSAPCTRCASERFSMRITGYVLVPRDGDYTFKIEKYGDDGVQVYVHGRPVIDMWTPGVGEDTGKLKLSAGYTMLRIHFRDVKGASRLKVLWDGPRSGMQPIPAHAVFTEPPRKPRVVKRSGLAPGVKGYVYRGSRPAGRPVAERIDTSLTFDWSGTPPAPGLPRDSYSVVWSGFLVASESGPYMFQLEHDGGGVVLTVGGRRVVNRPGSTKGNVFSNLVTVPRGPAAFNLLFTHEKSNRAFVRLSWVGPNFPMRPVAGGDLAHRGEFAVVKPAPEPPPRIPAGEPKRPTEPLPKDNLVRNGGFEQAGQRGQPAQEWTKGQWGPKKGGFIARLDRTNSHGGGMSLVVLARAAEVHPGAETKLASALQPGRYEIRFWACAAVGKSADVHAQLARRDVVSASVGEDWKEVTAAVEIIRKQPQTSLRLYTTTPGVRVWFDDVEVRAAGPAR